MDKVWNIAYVFITSDNINLLDIKSIKNFIKEPRGLHLVKLCHSTFVRGIWNNTPIFKKYWKIPPKIVFFNPLPICLADFKKPLFSLYIACIHFFIYIFYTPLYFYLREKKTKHKKGRHLIGALRQITLLGI